MNIMYTQTKTHATDKHKLTSLDFNSELKFAKEVVIAEGNKLIFHVQLFYLDKLMSRQGLKG